MNILEFKKDIVEDELKPFYIVSGEEIGVITYFLKNIKSETIRADSVSSIWKNLTSKSMFESSKVVYIVRDDEEFIKSEKVWKGISEKIKYGTLIFLVTKLNKNSVFYKQNEDVWVEFERQSSYQLCNYFYKKSNGYFNHAEIEYLVEKCKLDFDRIDNELDKVMAYCLRNEEEQINVEKLIDDIVFEETEFDIFEVLNNILSRKELEAFQGVETMIKNGENVLGILTLLYNNFINGAKVLGSSTPTEKNLKIPKFQIGMITRNFRYSVEQAFEGIKILDDCIDGVKNGKYDSNLALRMAVFKLSSL